jgi:hypothetical protein
VLIALTQGRVLDLIVLAYFVVVHVIEGDVVGPRVMGRAIGIHPMTAILALLAGTELFGIWGALFGAPLAGPLRALATAFWRELRKADSGPEQQVGTEHLPETAYQTQSAGGTPVAVSLAAAGETVDQCLVGRGAEQEREPQEPRNGRAGQTLLPYGVDAEGI